MKNKIKALWAALLKFWNSLPPATRAWIKGAEVAVVTAAVSAYLAAPAADFTTKKGISEFIAGVAAASYAALRLYVAQSPVPVLVKKTETGAVNLAVDGKMTASFKDVTTTSGGAANKEA